MLRLRVGCHFGECILLENDAWIGWGMTLAKHVESSAAPNTLYVTESVLSIIDLPLYAFEEAGSHALKGDHIRSRVMYQITSVRDEVLLSRVPQEMTAERWFMRGVGLANTGVKGAADGAGCYRHALRLQPNYPWDE